MAQTGRLPKEHNFFCYIAVVGPYLFVSVMSYTLFFMHDLHLFSLQNKNDIPS